MPPDDTLFPLEEASFKDLKISKERTEPLFWICEIRFLAKFSSESVHEIRRIVFRKGLNIIWAEPPKEFHSDDTQRIAGHATGKTTLCRMIRFLLGENHFANGQLRSSISRKFPDGYVAGHIRVNDIDWCIARPFGFGKYNEYAMKTASLDDFLKDNSLKEKYHVFKDSMASLLPQISSASKLSTQSKLTFYHLLPLFTRDQDSQYTKLAEWRDNTLSDAGSPVLQQKSAMLVMRSLISNIVEKECELLAEHEQFDAKYKETKSACDLINRILQKDCERLSQICQESIENAEMGRLFVETIRNNCKQRMESFCVDLDDEKKYQELMIERDNAKLDYQQAADQYNASLRNYRQDKREYLELEMMSGVSTKEFSKDDLDEIEDAAQHHPSRKYCCVPMTVAKEHHCPWAEWYTTPEDTTSKNNLLHACSYLENRFLELQNYRTFLDEERKHVLLLKRDFEKAKESFDSFSTEINKKRNQRAAKIGNQLEAIHRFEEDDRISQEMTKQIDLYKEKLKNCKDDIIAYRKKEKLISIDFSKTYDDVIKYVLGSDVVGRVDINDGNIKLSSSYNSSTLQSAALDAVKNICFDIATMIYSIVGKGTHPRFLMHDGPRVADVTRSIYLCYFKLMHEIEHVSQDNPNFQYIITTTEPPPDELQKEPWLICKLDATDIQGRLLKCNLD